MRYSQPGLVDRLASAYVLGLLSDRARRRFLRLHRDRPDVQLAVAQWEQRLGRLAESVPPVKPPPRVWSAIEAGTRPQPATATSKPGSAWWPAGWGLGGLIAGGALAVAVLASSPALLFTPDQVAMRAGQKLPASYVGLLTDAQGNGKLLASSLRHGRTLVVKAIGPIDAPAQGRLVLWAVPSDGKPPFVLGDVPTNGSASAELRDTSEKLLAQVGKLMVTVETAAAPATPSGPPVYTGNCAKLW